MDSPQLLAGAIECYARNGHSTDSRQLCQMNVSNRVVNEQTTMPGSSLRGDVDVRDTVNYALASVGVLSMPLLTTIAFLGGVLTLFFDVAYQAIIPGLVERKHLMEANSKLELARTAAATSGPGLAGWLVRAIKRLSDSFDDGVA